MAACFRVSTRSEDKFSRKPPLSLPPRSAKTGVRSDQRRGYGAKIRGTDVCVRIVKVWRIGDAKSFGFKLEGQPLPELEVSHQAHVQVEVAGSA